MNMYHFIPADLLPITQPATTADALPGNPASSGSLLPVILAVAAIVIITFLVLKMMKRKPGSAEDAPAEKKAEIPEPQLEEMPEELQPQDPEEMQPDREKDDEDDDGN